METIINVEASGTDLTSEGTNQVWDASKLGIDGSFQLAFVNLSATPYEETFTEANIVESNPNGRFIFYEETETELLEVGSANEGWSVTTYTNPKTILQFPMDLGDSFVEKYASTTEFDGYSPNFITGSTQVTVDAQGDLIMPYGPIENTIRIKTVESGVDSNEDYGDYFFNVTRYTWYDLEYGSRIANYIIADYGYGYGEQTFFQYISEDSYTSIKEQATIPNLQVYPNPASDYLQVSGTDSGSEYKLINQQGQEVLSGTISGEERIDTSEFTSGIYFLEIKNNQAVSRKKISIR